MSSTNRGARRNDRDVYLTPAWLTRAILPHLAPLITRGTMTRSPSWTPRIFEPAAGDGGMARTIRETWPDADVDLADIEPIRGVVPFGDFLLTEPRPDYDLVITNPPFSLALEFCQRALLWRRTPGSVVAMLLRLGFLGAQKRGAWLRENTPSVYVTPRRPSFTGGGNDSADYAWMVWGPGPARVVMLEMDLLDDGGLR
jgi:hypothetical protein